MIKRMPVPLWILLIFLIFFPCLSLGAADFGLVLDTSAGYGGQGSDKGFDFSGSLIPRFSTFLGDNGELYVSAGVKADYPPETWTLTPELLRTDVSFRFGNKEITAGRMHYADPLGIIADGLFDGALFSLHTGLGDFSVGTWYTGLIEKKRANITMTGEELQSYYTELDYSDFYNTYFAPRRLVSALGWEHPGLWEIVRTRVSLLAQFDLSGDTSLHSQYLAAQLSLPVWVFAVNLGGCLELIENPDETSVALMGELGLGWKSPAPFEDQLSLEGRFSSGVVEDSTITAFLPLSTVQQGDVLKAKISGLSVIALNYLARLHRSFSVGVSSSYFVRSDLGTLSNFGEEGYFVGNEFFGRLFWSPVSDVQVVLGGGVFLPSMGNVDPQADAPWRVELSLILALY